ncbi:MAG: hypothetical protein ACRDZM_16275 [Acidimicrobiia bacterium]
MSYFSRTEKKDEMQAFERFADPVAYLAGLGIEAELVEATTTLDDAA